MYLPFYEEAAEAATTESQQRPKKRVLKAARKEQNRSTQRAYYQNSPNRMKLFINSGSPASTRHVAFSSSPVKIPPSTTGEASAVRTNSSYIADAGASRIHFMQNTGAACSFTYKSPICQPKPTPQTDPKELLTSANLPMTSTMSTNLRSTLSQLGIPYHASLNLIPLPLLRERAIILLAAMPFAYNWTEFKTGTFVRGGLMVLSSSATVFNDAVTNTERSCLQPWDSEYWEAGPWFPEKKEHCC
ncbi:hypothetical protein J3F84DRAFT_396646 [Trichoderma pleuroticola]